MTQQQLNPQQRPTQASPWGGQQQWNQQQSRWNPGSAWNQQPTQPGQPLQPGQRPQWPAPTPTPAKKKGISPLVGLLVLTLAIGGIMVGVKALSGGGGSDVAYQNESYKVPEATKDMPELPTPKDWDEAKLWLEKNKFYEQPVATPVRCDAEDIDLENASKQELQDHMNEVVGCLMRAWGPSMEKSGYELPRPTVTIYDSPIQTACGKIPTHNAVWCGADQQIYYASDLPDIMPSQIRGKRWTVEAVVAHEFGHHLQGRTGIFFSGRAFQGNTKGDESKRYSRRTELQADCFSGAFLHSVSASRQMTQDDLGTIKTMFSGFGDNRKDPSRVGDHGSTVSRGYWAEVGLSAQQVQSCNTYVAPTNQVR